jgi:hypothetical protein
VSKSVTLSLLPSDWDDKKLQVLKEDIFVCLKSVVELGITESRDVSVCFPC